MSTTPNTTGEVASIVDRIPNGDTKMTKCEDCKKTPQEVVKIGKLCKRCYDKKRRNATKKKTSNS